MTKISVRDLMVDWSNRENNAYSKFNNFIECVNHICNNNYELLDDLELYNFYIQAMSEQIKEKKTLLDDHLESIKKLKFDLL